MTLFGNSENSISSKMFNFRAEYKISPKKSFVFLIKVENYKKITTSVSISPILRYMT